jgi:DNA-binding winged helix-turn-helix (wHTH) protein/pimeloyl-ACP methyl ester carboxylesterase
VRGNGWHVEPRALDVLHHLVRHRDRVVGKDELLDAVWGDSFVSEAALSTALRTARIAVGDSGSDQRVLRTVHRRGYQFVAEVTVSGDPAGATAPATEPLGQQTIRFCRSPDGTRLAYALSGGGPPLVKAANWKTHLDLERTSPVWAHWLDGLAQYRTLIRYDGRGCGMSDREAPRFDLDAFVEDLETVVDAVGLDSFSLLGVSQGGAVAIAYAVRHPDRVDRLVLVGACARGGAVRAQDDTERAVAAVDVELARVGRDREDPSFLQVFASQFIPEGSPAEWADFTRFLRQTTSAENAVRFLEAFAEMDVSDVAPPRRRPDPRPAFPGRRPGTDVGGDRALLADPKQ